MEIVRIPRPTGFVGSRPGKIDVLRFQTGKFNGDAVGSFPRKTREFTKGAISILLELTGEGHRVRKVFRGKIRREIPRVDRGVMSGLDRCRSIETEHLIRAFLAHTFTQ